MAADLDTRLASLGRADMGSGGRRGIGRSRATSSVARDYAGTPLVVGLADMAANRWNGVGVRAERLSIGSRAGLPIPAGSVLTAASLATPDLERNAPTVSLDEILDESFATLGSGGRLPLMVSASAVTPPDSAADRIIASRAVTTRSELLHTVRRLSATAGIIGDVIAIVIQREVDSVTNGTLVASRSPERVAASIDPETSAADRSRLAALAKRVARTFRGARSVAWSIDRNDQLWILDIGPELDRSPGEPQR